MEQSPAAANPTNESKALWEVLTALLNHALVGTLIFASTAGLAALMDRARAWLNFPGTDAVSFVLRWGEFALIGINALLYLLFLARIVVGSADRILKNIRGPLQ